MVDMSKLERFEIGEGSEKIPMVYLPRSQRTPDYNIKECIINILGSGDTKESFIPTMERLAEIDHSLVGFSFRGRESGYDYPKEQQYIDLREVIDYLRDVKGYDRFTLVATSMGFISTADVIADKKYSKLIRQVILFDPADYPADFSRSSWAGNSEFNPTVELVSSRLKKLKGYFPIDIVFFGLKNFIPKTLATDFASRGSDILGGYTRLSRNMTENLYLNIKELNRGVFIIDRLIPHAFERDGDVERNYDLIADYIQNLIFLLNDLE